MHSAATLSPHALSQTLRASHHTFLGDSRSLLMAAALPLHAHPLSCSAACGVPLRWQQPSSPKPRVAHLRIAAEVAHAAVINPGIKKDIAKVVDTVVTGELSKPLTAYCRCWRSGIFPLCDGTHAKHNKETGDNVGPLLVKK